MHDGCFNFAVAMNVAGPKENHVGSPSTASTLICFSRSHLNNIRGRWLDFSPLTTVQENATCVGRRARTRRSTCFQLSHSLLRVAANYASETLKLLFNSMQDRQIMYLINGRWSMAMKEGENFVIDSCDFWSMVSLAISRGAQMAPTSDRCSISIFVVKERRQHATDDQRPFRRLTRCQRRSVFYFPTQQQ